MHPVKATLSWAWYFPLQRSPLVERPESRLCSRAGPHLELGGKLLQGEALRYREEQILWTCMQGKYGEGRCRQGGGVRTGNEGVAGLDQRVQTSGCRETDKESASQAMGWTKHLFSAVPAALMPGTAWPPPSPCLCWLPAPQVSRKEESFSSYDQKRASSQQEGRPSISLSPT